MLVIDKELLDGVTAQAKASPRSAFKDLNRMPLTDRNLNAVTSFQGVKFTAFFN